MLGKVESDLAGFLRRLGKWVEHVAPDSGRRVVDYFAENMNVPMRRA